VRLHRLPRVLLLHLCRFEWLSAGEGGGQAAKLHGHLPFPQQLALRHGWLSDDCPDRPRGGGGGGGGGAAGAPGAAGPPRYNLQAVVTHLGKHSHGESRSFFGSFAPHQTTTKPVARVSRLLFPSAGKRVAGGAFLAPPPLSPSHHRGGPTSIANRDHTFRQAGSRYPFASTRVDSC
jgi:hypothetical protein